MPEKPKSKIGQAASMFPVKPHSSMFQKPRYMHPLEENATVEKLSAQTPVWAQPDRQWHDDYSYYITDEGNIARKPGWNEYDAKVKANRNYNNSGTGISSENTKRLNEILYGKGSKEPYPELRQIPDEYKKREISYTVPQHSWNKKSGGTISAGTLLGAGAQKHFFTESFEKSDYGDKAQWPNNYRKELLGKGVKTEVYPFPFKHGGKVKPQINKREKLLNWAKKNQQTATTPQFSNGGQIVWGTKDHRIINM